MTAVPKPSTTQRIATSKARSVQSRFHASRKIFSVKVTDGASSVALAVLVIAESSAPKNTICANKGVCCRMKVGKISCVSWSPSPASKVFTIAGSISVAEYARKIGMKAKIKYSEPPATELVSATRSFLAEVIR